MGEHCDQCQVRHTPGLKAPPQLRMAPDLPSTLGPKRWLLPSN